MIEERDLEFVHALWSRRVVVSYILFGINILIFVLMEFAGGTTNEATLLAFGVKSNPQIDQGEVWRLITPIFIHIGLLHLFFNSYALWVVGPQVEKLYGGARFFTIYVLAGVAGVLASYWRHPESISAGASGAIFGMFGALLVFGFKYRKSIPPFFQQAVGRGVLPVIVLNLIIGFSIPGIDNAAHIGGMIAGAALAAIIPYEKVGASTHFGFRLVQTALTLVIAASFYEVAAHYDGPSPSLPKFPRNWAQLMGGGTSTDEFVTIINNAEQALADSFDELSSLSLLSQPDPSDLARLESELTKTIDELNRVPSIGRRADEMSSKLRELAQSQYEIVREIDRAKAVSYALSRRARENAERYENVRREFSKWVEDEGSKYGIQLRKQP